MAISLRLMPSRMAFDAFDHVTRFVVLVEGSVQADRLALAAGGPEFLAEATLIVGDQRVGGLEDAGGGAVVLFGRMVSASGKSALNWCRFSMRAPRQP